MLCWDEAFCESEIARKEALHYTEQLPGLREGEVASEKIDSPEQRCRQKHGKARPPIPRSFLRDVSFRGGRLRGRACASEPSDTYAWAVMSVGPGALLYGESVISMLGLAPTNPTRMFVATPRRTRRKLPDSIKVEWLRGIKPTATYNGIPCQSAQDAILSCKGKCCPIDWKLRRRQHASKASSTSSNTTR